MPARDRISAAIGAAVAEGRPALVGFLTAGFPTRADFKRNLTEVASVCDVVEIGVPFSDPMADGSTIQRASFAALGNGVTLPWILDELSAWNERRVPLLLMSYLNPLLAFGREELPPLPPLRACRGSSSPICRSRRAVTSSWLSTGKASRWCKWSHR